MKTRILLLVAIVLTIVSSEAIIIRHDVDPGEYEVRDSDYPAVFFLERQGSSKVCVATVIHSRWAITAAHCADQTMLNETLAQGRRFGVRVANKDREIDLMIAHPGFDMDAGDDVDLALLRFREESAIPRPIPLHSSADELGQVVSLLGWGYFGRGLRGREYDDGRLRLAQNRVTQVDNRLRTAFDDPRMSSGAALPLEGTLSLGDSGGPALLHGSQGATLAGVAVGEVTAADFSEETQGKYGAIAIYERISRHLDWIETVIGPGTGTSHPGDS